MGVLFQCHVGDSETTCFTTEISRNIAVLSPTTFVRKTGRGCHRRFVEMLKFQTLLTTDQNRSWACRRAKRSFESLSLSLGLLNK